MKFKDYPCNPANYGGLRRMPPEYIVIHYTAGMNDTAENNGAYFAREYVGASAHYFVDSGETVVRSVPIKHAAWHCGGAIYYCDCRNHNSIGIEICSRYANGEYWLEDEAVARAVELTKALMEKYGIDEDHVVRHFDVTHKVCPAPMCGEHQDEWLKFKEAIRSMRYQNINELPDWAKPTVQKLIDKGILNGTDKGLDLSKDMVRMMVYNDRAGLYG